MDKYYNAINLTFLKFAIDESCVVIIIIIVLLPSPVLHILWDLFTDTVRHLVALC